MSIQRNYAWLEITEYLFIAASMIGSIAAVAVNQAIFMAVPMSISLMLNLLHRKKLLNLSRKRIGFEVKEECQEVSNMTTSLKASALQNIPTLPLEQMESGLVNLCQKVEDQQLEMNRLMNHLDEFSKNIRQSIKNIPREIQEIKENLDRIQEPEKKSFEEEISSIKTQLARISEELTQVDRNTESLVPKKNFNQVISTIKILCNETLDLRKLITQLNQTVAKISKNYDPRLNLVKEDLTDSDLTNLTLKDSPFGFASCDPWGDPKTASRIPVATLGETQRPPGTFSSNPFQDKFDNCLQQISGLRGSLAELTRAIDLLERRSEQIVPRSELRGLISDTIEMQWENSMIKQATISQFLSLDSFSPNSGQGSGNFSGGENGFSKSNDFDRIPQLHRDIENLSEEIATLEAQMENRLSPLEAIDRHGIAEDLSLQAQAIAQLQQQTNKLLAFYEGAREVGE